MERIFAIDQLRTDQNTQVGVQVQGTGSIHGPVTVNQATYHYNPENDGKIGSFNFDLSSLTGIRANRDNELDAVRATLEKPTGTGAKLAILVGLGGAGKTTLARMYTQAENNLEPFDNFIWIDAEEPPNVTATFQSLLKDHLRMNRHCANDQQLIEAVYGKILNHKTLIVFDNVEKFELIRQFIPKMTLPKAPPPRVIITSRITSGWQEYEDHMVPVRELSWQVSQVYIRENLVRSPVPIPDIDEKWEELAEYFGCLVIALRAATMSIVEQNKLQRLIDGKVYTIEAFLNQVKNTHVPVEDPDDPTEATYRPLRQLWTATLDGMSDRPYGPLGERILQVMTYMSPTGVPVNWFPILCAQFGDFNETSFIYAMNFLTSWSLIERSERNAIAHRVLQDTLLTRLKTRPEKRIEALNWLLPATTKLHIKLWTGNKLQNFHPNLNKLLKHMQDEIKGQVQDSVVAFLVKMNLNVIKITQSLLQDLVQNVFEEEAFLTPDGLKLLSTAFMVDNKILLVPQRLQAANSGNVENQLQFLSKILCRKPDYQKFPKLYSSLAFYQAVSQVVTTWEPVKHAHAHMYVIQTVKHLCEGLSEWIKAQIHIDSVTISKLYEVFSKLLRGLLDALELVFIKSAIMDMEHQLKSVQAVFNYQLALAALDGIHQPETLPPKYEPLDSALVLIGVDHMMVSWYQIQLEKLYGKCPGFVRNAHIDHQIKLESRMVASIAHIMSNHITNKWQHQNLPTKSYHPAQVELVVSFSNFWTFETKFCSSIIPMYIVYLVLEMDLELMEQILEEQQTETLLPLPRDIDKFIQVLTTAVHYSEWVYQTGERSPTLKFFKGFFSAKTVFPNLKKLTQITDKLVVGFLDKNSLLSQLLSTSDSLEPKEFYTKLKRFFDNRSSTDIPQLRLALEQLYETVVADSSKNQCRCFAFRIQTKLARLDLDQGKNGTIILASEAFGHQLYCQMGSYKIGKTVQLLFDAFEKFNHDSQLTHLRKENLLRKLFERHSDSHGPESLHCRRCQATLTKFLCSTGSILEAADIVERWVTDIGLSQHAHYGVRDDEFLTVSLLLLLHGEHERALGLSKCLLRKYAVSTESCPKEQTHCHDFAKVLKTLASTPSDPASSSSVSSFAIVSEFRKGIRIYPGVDDRFPSVFQKWYCDQERFSHARDSGIKYCQKHRIDMATTLASNVLALLWFDAMEQVLLVRESSKFINATLFEPLVSQLELRKVGMEFRVDDSLLEWGIKCFVGMFQRKELWFQMKYKQMSSAQKLKNTVGDCSLT